MRIPPPLVFTFCCLALGRTALTARAQQQERGLMERIQHPDLSLAYHPATKSFGGSAGSAPWKKRVTTRSFLSGRTAASKSYRAKGFEDDVRVFRPRPAGFAPGSDHVAALNSPAPGTDRSYLTRDVAVGEAREVRKALPVRDAQVPNFVPVGKRQDALDEQQRTHPLTIEEVRELLNKSR